MKLNDWMYMVSIPQGAFRLHSFKPELSDEGLNWQAVSTCSLSVNNLKTHWGCLQMCGHWLADTEPAKHVEGSNQNTNTSLLFFFSLKIFFYTRIPFSAAQRITNTHMWQLINLPMSFVFSFSLCSEQIITQTACSAPFLSRTTFS